jgi:hypothetical protein
LGGNKRRQADTGRFRHAEAQEAGRGRIVQEGGQRGRQKQAGSGRQAGMYASSEGGTCKSSLPMEAGV